MPPVNQMRQSNLIFNTWNWCETHTKKKRNTQKKHSRWNEYQWQIPTHTPHSTAQHRTDVRNRRKHKYWKSFSHPIILIVALRLAFLMKFIEWRRQINIWFFRYRIWVKIFFFLISSFWYSIPFACPQSFSLTLLDDKNCSLFRMKSW